jgi:hypothetical protein
MTHIAIVDNAKPHHIFDNQHFRDFLPIDMKWTVRESHSKQIEERVTNLSFSPNGIERIVRMWAKVSENAH